jgi:EAL domain-containing protein (putative c-di-GMP-specific phosphodiesterase class I)/DNA-binding NarL/FixJ family response regulator
MEQLVVLLVDDDAAVRRALVRLLGTDDRVRTLQASAAVEALRTLERERVDVVISDEVMPEINGVRLFEMIRSRWPATRRVLYTGHPDADVVMNAINRGGVDKALAKGIHAAQLRAELGELIEDCLARRLGRPSEPPRLLLEGEDGVDARPTVMLVSDDPATATDLRMTLEQATFFVRTSDRASAVALHASTRADVIVLDLSGRSDEAHFMQSIRAVDLDCPVVVTAAHDAIDRAHEAMRYGAYRYLLHPFASEALVLMARQAATLHRMAKLRREVGAGQSGAWALGDRAALEVGFRRAIEQLYMLYQPIVSWSQRRVIGYEALVRSREQALPHPGALFDAAARLDRTDELGRAIRRIAPTPYHQNDQVGWLFLNVSVAELGGEELFEPHLASMAHRIVLEVTERAALDTLGGIETKIAALRGLGYRIAIDDLGAGYAGLSSFAVLEPDIVKLDMTLIRNIHRAPVKQRLVAGMRAACEDLGVTLIAEGVETVEERDALLATGCDGYQGYLFARPAPAFVEPTW